MTKNMTNVTCTSASTIPTLTITVVTHNFLAIRCLPVELDVRAFRRSGGNGAEALRQLPEALRVSVRQEVDLGLSGVRRLRRRILDHQRPFLWQRTHM